MKGRLARRSIIVTEQLGEAEWKAQGQPLCWIRQEAFMCEGVEFYTWVDVGYGNIGWTSSSAVPPAVGQMDKYSCQHPRGLFIVLCKEYYDLEQMAFVRAELLAEPQT